MLCMVVLLFAMTTGVMGYYQKDRDPIEDPTGTSEVETTPIPTVNRQTELADAKRKNPDAMAWLYIPGAEVDDLVMAQRSTVYRLTHGGRIGAKKVSIIIFLILTVRVKKQLPLRRSC